MKHTIVVLEDDEDIRTLYTYILEQESYEVKSFENIQSFYQHIHALNPSLFILDVMLPDGTGLDVCQHLKQHNETMHTPVIILSAHANLKDVERCAMDLFMNKPFEIDHLIGAVNKLVH